MPGYPQKTSSLTKVTLKELDINVAPIRLAIQECFDWFKQNSYL